MDRGITDAPPAGVVTKVLCLLTRIVSRRPRATLCLVLLSVAACGGWAALHLKFKTSRSDLIDPSVSFQQRWLKFTEKFGEQSDIVIVVEADDRARVRLVLDEIGQRLVAEPEFFARVAWKFDPAPLRRKGLQYLSPRELEQGLTRLEAYAPLLAGHWSRAGLESYCRRLALHARWARDNNQPAAAADAVQQAARLSDSLIRFAGAILQGPGPQLVGGVVDLESAGRQQLAHAFVSPWPEVFSPDARSQALSEVRYQLSDDGRMGFVLAAPVGGQSDFSGESPALARVRKILDEVRSRYSDCVIGVTGIPVLESDEMRRSQLDMSRASLISFAGVALVLLIGFRGWRHPMLGLLMLAVGLVWAVGYTTLAVGHLNILSVSFAAVLIGLGIDFAVHYLARYLELRQEGVDLLPALEKSSTTVGTGLVTAAVTTALAFFCAALTKFLGVAELGLIAGGGVLLCALATFLVLIPLVRLADDAVEPQRLPQPFQGRVLRWATSRRPWGVALLSAGVILGLSGQALEWRDGGPKLRVKYDSNLLNLQADDVESVEVQRRIFEKSNGSLLYAVSLAHGPAEARRLAARMASLDSVARVEHLADVMPPYPPEETSLLVQAIHARLANLSPMPREFPSIDPLSIGHAFEELLKVLAESTAPAGLAAAGRLDAFLNQFEQVPLEHQVQILSGYQSAMLTALHAQFEHIAAASDPVPVSVADIPAATRERFVSPQGDWQLRIFPRHQIWDAAPLERFVSDVRSLDPEATGTPLQNYEAANQIRQSYLNAALYALLVVILVLLVDSLASGPLCVALLSPLVVVSFGAVTLAGPNQAIDIRWMACLYVAVAVLVAAIFDHVNVRNMALSMAPPLLGLLMMFGVLGVLGEHLNPANIIVLPLLLGVGVDYGVLVVHDYRTQAGEYRISASTINSVVLTSLTSMVGFGSMLIASHRGLASLGLVLAVGVASCLFVALVALPATLSLLGASSEAGRSPSEQPDDHLAPEADSPVVLAWTPPLLREASDRRSYRRAS